MSNLLESRQEPIPGYRLIERLGRGGYGDVWKVEAPGGFHKAMKFVFGVLGDEGEAAANQELGALHCLVQIRHPFILSVERCDVIDGQVVITMELADRSLEDRFKECKSEGKPGVPRDELLQYMQEAAEALDLLSLEYQLQHLDIKPTNIFLVRRHVKVGDFGLVKKLDAFEAPFKSGLTPLYAPPESYEGTVTLNSDQYSLALVYHEMLTGRRAIDGDSGRELMFRTLVKGPNLEAVAEPERSVLARALAKQPADRFPSCQQFVAAIRECVVTAPTAAEIAFDEDAERAHFELQTNRTPSSVGLTPTPVEAGESPDDSEARYGARRIRRFSIAELRSQPRPDVHPEGRLQPTLVVGLGGFGVRMSERVRKVLSMSYGEAARRLPVHLLNIDVDLESLKWAARKDGVDRYESPAFICRLRKAAEYKQVWEQSKHLSSWMDQEQVFRIGLGGETRGLRTLGRLAVVDNYERLAQQITSSIASLISVETAEESATWTGLRYRCVDPCVYVAAGMGGGVGSGMAVDVAYLVRNILESAGFKQPKVILALVAGIDPAGDRDLQNVNQYALANDLAAHWNDGFEYATPTKVGDLPEFMAGPPARATLFWDATAEHLIEPRDRAVLDSFAELAVQTAAGEQGGVVLEAIADGDPFVGAGWLSLVHPHDLVLRTAGCEFAGKIIDHWLRPLDEQELEDRRHEARQFFEKNGYEPVRVAERLAKQASSAGDESIHKQAAKRINKLIEVVDQSASKKAPQLVIEARAELRRLLGGDPVDDDGVYEGLTPYEKSYRQAGAKLVELLFQPIRRELETIIETIDRRFEVVRGAWTGFSDALAGLIKKLVESPTTKKLENDAYDAAYQLHKALVINQATPRELVQLVETWVRTKLEHNGRKQLIGLYQLLKSMINDLAVQIFSAPRKLEAAQKHLVELREAAINAEQTLVHQPIFSGGAVTVNEALDHWRQRLVDTDVARIEDWLRTNLFAPAGGFWATCARDDIPAGVLAEEMASGTATFLLREIPVGDAAQVFLDRHPSLSEAFTSELRALLDWTAPSFAPKPGATKRTNDTTTVLVPATNGGQNLAAALLELDPDRNFHFRTHTGVDVHFLNVASSNSLARIAPAWILRAKPLFESPKYRSSATVYPQTANV